MGTRSIKNNNEKYKYWIYLTYFFHNILDMTFTQKMNKKDDPEFKPEENAAKKFA